MDGSPEAASVEAVGFWWHSIDLGNGLVTPGYKSPALLATELESLRLPDLSGRRVLDVGAWDGFFSFACEQRGAAEVVALDHFVWSMDLAATMKYREECLARSICPEAPETVPGLWQPDTLPGKSGFDTAHRIRGSEVEPRVGDFMTTDLETLGRFDVVLYLGVLYHMADPLGSLRRLASVTRDTAIIETEAMLIPAHPEARLAEFHPFGELNHDVSNWWVPTLPALVGLCRAAGFSEVEAMTPPPPIPTRKRFMRRPEIDTAPINYRLVVHARI